MSRVSRCVFNSEVRYSFHCPGCGYGHAFRTEGSAVGPKWEFNGSLDRPTFSPSLLYTPEPGTTLKRCHLFVRDGMIQFLDDCDHALKGQTVEMEDVNS